MNMKFFAVTASALLLFSAAAAAPQIEKFELDGYKFESFNSSAKSLGNGAFELTINPGTTWPMIHIAPPVIPADANTVSITVQQIAPQGPAPYFSGIRTQKTVGFRSIAGSFARQQAA